MHISWYIICDSVYDEFVKLHSIF